MELFLFQYRREGFGPLIFMATKELRIDASTGTIVIGNYPVTSSMITDPFSNLININFHSSLNYMKVKQLINLGAVSIPDSPPVYAFDELQYVTVSTTTISSPTVGVDFSLTYLVVNNVVYPNGYSYSESSTGFGRLHVNHYFETAGHSIYLQRTTTAKGNTVPGVYLNSVEILVIG